MENITVALIQPDLIWEDKQKNLDKFEIYFAEFKEHPDLVILPEMFNTGFVIEPEAVAEEPDGPTLQWLGKQSLKMGSVITGSYVIKERSVYFNRLIWMKPDGTFAYYDKRHLFRYGNEHMHFEPGNRKLVMELKGWKICPLVCYDLRFPVWSKNNYINGTYEYDLLIYVSNWPGKRSYAFRQLLIARAIENQAYVIGLNRVGMDGKGTWHQGESAVFDYLGRPVVEIPPDVEDAEIVTLNYEKLNKFRGNFTVGLDWDTFVID
jgi:omega-amidase